MLVRVSFPGESYLENWIPEGDFWHHPLEFLFFRPKNEFRKLPSTPLYGKNGIAQCLMNESNLKVGYNACAE